MSLKIKTGSDAALIVSNAIQSHSDLWNKIDKIEDINLRGKRILSSEKLKKKGLDWVNNWTYGKGRMKLERAVSEEVKMIVDALNLCDIEFVTFDKSKHKKKLHIFLQIDFLRSLFSRIISTAFVDAILEDQRFHLFLNQIEFNCVSYGYCPITIDDFSYLGTANHIRKIAFEDKTTFGNVTTWVCFDIVKGEFLRQKYKELEETTGETTWKQEAILDLVKTLIPASDLKVDGGTDITITSWQNVEDLISRKGESWFYYNTNNINIAKIYQLLPDGEFTETYIGINFDITQPPMPLVPSVSCKDKILFQSCENGKNLADVLHLIKDFSIGPSQTIAELRGIGKIIAEDSMRFDRKKNSIEDKLLLSGSPFFTTNGALAGEKTGIAVAGGYVVLDQGIELVPQQIRFDLSSHVNSIQLDEAHFERELQHHTPSLQGRLSSRPTKDEVQAESQEVSSQKGAKTTVKLADYSAFLTGIFNSLWSNSYGTYSQDKRIQKMFFDSLEDSFANYGIELKDIKEVLGLIKRITITPVFGDLAAIREALSMCENSNGRRYLTTCYLIRLGFSRQDIRLILEEFDDGIEIQIAAFENNVFINSSEVVFFIGQDHIGHLNTHFAKCDRVLKGVAGGEDPVKALNFITNALSNTEKHVEAIKVIPFYAKKYKQFKEIQDIFVEKAKELAQLVAEMQAKIQQAGAQQQQQGGGISPEAAAKIQIKQTESVEKMRRAAQAFEQRSQQKNAEFQQRMELASMKTSADVANKKEIADVKNDIEALRASMGLIKESNQNA